MPSLLRRAKRAFSSDFFKLAMIIAIGAVIWNISPTPQLSANAFHVLSTFCCVILCLLCLPCTPIGLIVAPALIVLTLSQSLKCEIKGTGKRIDCSMCNNNKSLTEGQAAYNCDVRTVVATAVVEIREMIVHPDHTLPQYFYFFRD